MSEKVQPYMAGQAQNVQPINKDNPDMKDVILI
jgi:hypothetical protein